MIGRVIATIAIIIGLVGIVLGIFGYFDNKQNSRDRYCKQTYGQDYHYNWHRGAPDCVNPKTGEGKWFL